MEQQRKLAVLARIAAELRQADVTWALGASGLLYFRGLAPDFHDLDLMVALEDAGKAERILDRLGQPLPPKPNVSIDPTAVFREYTVDGMEADLMEGMVIVKDGAAHDCSLRPEDIGGTVTVCGRHVPPHSPARRRRYYALMGREEKAKLLSHLPEHH